MAPEREDLRRTRGSPAAMNTESVTVHERGEAGTDDDLGADLERGVLAHAAVKESQPEGEAEVGIENTGEEEWRKRKREAERGEGEVDLGREKGAGHETGIVNVLAAAGVVTVVTAVVIDRRASQMIWYRTCPWTLTARFILNRRTNIRAIPTRSRMDSNASSRKTTVSSKKSHTHHHHQRMKG